MLRATSGFSPAVMAWLARPGAVARSHYFAPPLPPSDQRLRGQFAVLGSLPDRHPMELFEQTLKGPRLIKAG